MLSSGGSFNHHSRCIVKYGFVFNLCLYLISNSFLCVGSQRWLIRMEVLWVPWFYRWIKWIFNLELRDTPPKKDRFAVKDSETFLTAWTKSPSFWTLLVSFYSVEVDDCVRAASSLYRTSYRLDGEIKLRKRLTDVDRSAVIQVCVCMCVWGRGEEMNIWGLVRQEALERSILHDQYSSKFHERWTDTTCLSAWGRQPTHSLCS